MNTSNYPPMGDPVHGSPVPTALPSRFASAAPGVAHGVSAKSVDDSVKPWLVVRYLVGILAAWTATIFAGRDVLSAPQSGNVVALVLAAAGAVMALFWVVQATRKFSEKKRPQSAGQPAGQFAGQPPMGVYPPDPRFSPGAPPQRGAAPGMPMPTRPGSGPAQYGYAGSIPSQDPQRAPDQGDTDKAAAVAAATPQESQFLNDPLFTLEDPGPRARLFRVPKDDTNLCQDSFACDSQREIYIVTDGVSRSLMPAPWARLVAREYVKFRAHLGDPFAREDVFRIWLASCKHQWRDWMYNTRASMLGATGNVVKTASVPWEKSIEHWHERINSKPSQTTAVACMIQRDGAGRDRALLYVAAIGDADCLVLRPDKRGALGLLGAFPLDNPKKFNDHPDTLSTDMTDAVVHEMFQHIRRLDPIEVRKGDVVILATDSVAQWLLNIASQAGSSKETPWPDLLEIASLASQEEFARLVEQECDAGHLERDDETMLIIPIS